MKYIPLILVLINVLFFIVQLSLPGFTESFVLNSSDVAQRPWILLTSIFLHASPMHLFGNMFALALFGLILEHNIGSRKFLVVYFIGGIVASIVSLSFYESSLGASGAIFAVLGSLAAVKPKMVVWAYGVPMPMFAAAGFWLLLDILGVFYPSNVANIAHIAGLVFGVVGGLLIGQKLPKEKKSKQTEPLSKEEMDNWEDEWMKE